MRQWAQHILFSILLGIGIGILAYLIARATTSAYLLHQQQQFFRETFTIIRGDGGIAALANSNIHEARMYINQLEAYYQQFSLQIGTGVGIVTALVSYAWMEWRRGKNENQ